MDNRGREGYEYCYRICTTDDNTMIPDEVIRRMRSKALNGISTFVLEMRTNFILTKTKTTAAAADDDSPDVLLDSERLYCVVHAADDERISLGPISVRLKDYWMPEDQIRKLALEAFDFAANRLPPAWTPRPVVVEVEVRTVEQEGEGPGAARDRAITVDSLFPLFSDYVPNVENYVACVLNRQRVQQGVDQGLMETCPICLREPTGGAQITILPRCKHAFHYRCIAAWLVRNNSCPLCRERVFRFHDKKPIVTPEEMDEIRDFNCRDKLIKIAPSQFLHGVS